MLKSHFDMKDLGEANFILDMKITKTCDGIFLNQSHYVEKILLILILLFIYFLWIMMMRFLIKRIS